MADMQIPVGLGWETGVEPSSVFTRLEVVVNKLLYKIITFRILVFSVLCLIELIVGVLDFRHLVRIYDN